MSVSQTRRVVDPAVREADERFDRMMKMFRAMTPEQRLMILAFVLCDRVKA